MSTMMTERMVVLGRFQKTFLIRDDMALDCVSDIGILPMF